METILGRFRNLIVLAAILFAQIIGLAVQVKRPAQQGDTRLIRVWAITAIAPFEKTVVHTQQFFHNIWFNYVYLRGVRRENRELRAELDQMKLEQVRMKEDAEMARRIQSLLAFKEQHIDTTVAAQVIGTSGSDQSRVLYIDKGSDDGIRTDMAVITPNGIVGKVVLVSNDSAQVLPINDQLSGVGVALQTSRLQGILRGTGSGTTTIQYVMADERVTPGEEVITSGGDRIFPKGLPVGKVVDVKPGKDLFLNIRVAPSANLDRLEEVLVITKKVEKPADVQDLGPIRASDILAQRLPGVPAKPELDANGNLVNGPNTTGTPTGTAPNAAGAATGSTAGATNPAVRTTPQQGVPPTKPAGTAATSTRPATGTPGGTATGTGTNRSATSAPKPATGTGATSTSLGTQSGAVKKPATGGAAGISTTGTTGQGSKPPAAGSVGTTNSAPARKPATQVPPPGTSAPPTTVPSTTPPAGDNPQR